MWFVGYGPHRTLKERTTALKIQPCKRPKSSIANNGLSLAPNEVWCKRWYLVDRLGHRTTSYPQCHWVLTKFSLGVGSKTSTITAYGLYLNASNLAKEDAPTITLPVWTNGTTITPFYLFVKKIFHPPICCFKASTKEKVGRSDSSWWFL